MKIFRENKFVVFTGLRLLSTEGAQRALSVFDDWMMKCSRNSKKTPILAIFAYSKSLMITLSRLAKLLPYFLFYRQLFSKKANYCVRSSNDVTNLEQFSKFHRLDLLKSANHSFTFIFSQQYKIRISNKWLKNELCLSFQIFEKKVCETICL